jgi:ammonium transporter Rh
MLFSVLLSVWQALIVLFFGLFTTYGNEIEGSATISSDMLAKDTIKTYYPMFQDVHIMIFVGFGFLMTFLKSHRFGSVALNFLLGALSLQTGILMGHFFHCLINNHWEELELNIKSLILGDFSAGAVLISLGAVLGMVSPAQAVVMTLLELVFFSLNEAIAVSIYESVDMGGSMVVHAFGSFFGLGVAYLLSGGSKKKHANNMSTYNNEVVAMIGTLFLWCYWPSFNGAMAVGNSQHRVIVNTVLGLTGSCVAAFAVSQLIHKRINAEDILNATLAGGVAIGSSSDLVVASYVSILVGFAAGGISVVNFHYLGPLLKSKLGIHDTCGVNNLHGIPGVMGGLIGAITAGTATASVYGDAVTNIFPAMANGRTAGEQAGFQLAALVTSIGISVAGGLITGLVCKQIPGIPEPFSDKGWVEEDEEIEKEVEMAVTEA